MVADQFFLYFEAHLVETDFGFLMAFCLVLGNLLKSFVIESYEAKHEQITGAEDADKEVSQHFFT